MSRVPLFAVTTHLSISRSPLIYVAAATYYLAWLPPLIYVVAAIYYLAWLPPLIYVAGATFRGHHLFKSWLPLIRQVSVAYG